MTSNNKIGGEQNEKKKIKARSVNTRFYTTTGKHETTCFIKYPLLRNSQVNNTGQCVFCVVGAKQQYRVFS
jgi:hypothetical protein